MATSSQDRGAGRWVEDLHRATNGHDLEALVACFAPGYVNETPAHPARGFRGHEQVRRNWEQIFAAVPDLTATVRWIAGEGEVWSEWEMRGTRRDGAAHLMRGVVIFTIEQGRAVRGRFYLEPVDDGDDDADRAVRRALGVASGSAVAVRQEER